MDDLPFASGRAGRMVGYRGLNDRYERLEQAATGRSDSFGAAAGRRRRPVKRNQHPALDLPASLHQVRALSVYPRLLEQVADVLLP
jgi:hypothetical protein